MRALEILISLKRSNPWVVYEGFLRRLKKCGLYIQTNVFLTCDHLSPQRKINLPGLSIRPLGVSEMDMLESIEGKDPTVFRKRIKEYGDQCRGFFFGNRLVGYAWLSGKMMRVPEIALEKPLGEDEIYLYDGIIAEQYRHLGFFVVFLTQLLDEALADGKKIVNTVEMTNYKSRQTFAKLGFRKTGVCTYARLGPFWQHRFTRVTT